MNYEDIFITQYAVRTWIEDRLFEILGHRETNDSVRVFLGIITPRLSYYRREMPPKALKIGTFFSEPVYVWLI